MNAGLSNLTAIKRRLLSDSLSARDDWNEVILQIGLGVAGTFERYCNRLLARVVAGTDLLPANSDHWFARRYPIESISKLEYRGDYTTGWVDQELTTITSVTETSGRIDWGGALGDHTGQIRITYTGGYWWDEDEGATGIMPAAATALPESLREAWLLQSEAIWTARDKLGTGITRPGGDAAFVTTTLFASDMIPIVQTMLRPFIRWQMLA